MKIEFGLAPAPLALMALCLLAGSVQAAPVVTEVPFSMTGEPTTPFERKLAEGRKAIQSREFALADALFKEAAAMDRKSAVPLLQLAESARVRNEPAAARRWLSEALALAPRDPATLRAWALWHYAMSEYPKANEFWQAALAADPRFVAVLVDLGDYHFNVLREPDGAAGYYERALAIDANLAGAHYALGIVLLQKGDLTESLKRLTEAARLSPGNALPLTAMAEVHVRRRETARALRMYEQALQAQPSYYAARLGKADLLLASGKPQQALTEYQAVAKSHAKVVAAHLGAGMSAQQLNQPESAMRSYQAAMALQPDNVLALNNAAWLASERGGVADGGLAWARKAAALAPDEPQVQGTLAWVLHKKGDTVQALQILERLIQGAGRTRAESHYLLGMVLADKGETQKAAVSLREALRINPGFAQAAEATVRLRKLEKG